MAGVTFHTSQRKVVSAHLSIGSTTTTRGDVGLVEQTVPCVGSSVSDHVVGVGGRPQSSLIEGSISLTVVGTRDSATLANTIKGVWAMHGIVGEVVKQLISILNVDSSTTDIVKGVLGDSGQMGSVDDDTTLVAVLHCITTGNAIGAVPHQVEVDAVTANCTTVSTLLNTGILNSLCATKSLVGSVHKSLKTEGANGGRCGTTRAVGWTTWDVAEIITSDDDVSCHVHDLSLHVVVDGSKVVLKVKS